MRSKPPSKPAASRRPVPPPPPRRNKVDFGPPPFPRAASRTPTFNDNPSESPTGRTSRDVADWRQVLQVFDELDIESKDALAQIAHALLKAQNARKGRLEK